MHSINVGKYKITVKDQSVKSLYTFADSDGVTIRAIDDLDSMDYWNIVQITTEGHIKGLSGSPYNYTVKEIKCEPICVDTAVFYAWAASILIHGEEPQSEQDTEEIHKFLDYIKPWYVVDVVRGTGNYGAPDGGGLPGCVMDYVIHRLNM